MNNNNGNDQNHPNRNWITAITFVTLLIFFVVLNAKMMAPFMLSILMGGILAILFFPYYQKLRNKHIGPMWSSGIVTASVALIVIIPLSFFILVAVKQGTQLAKNISENENLTLDSVAEKITQFKFIRPLVEDEQEVKEKLTKSIKESSSSTAQSVLGAVGSIPDRLLQLVLALLACFFFLVDGRKFVVFLNDKIPLDGDVRTKLYGSFKNTAISVIWATIAAAGAQAALMFFSFLLMGVPGAFLAGGATFILAWIPFIGSVPVWVGGAIYLYTQDQIGLVIVMIVMGMFTGVIDNYIRPLVLKGRDELHPLLSLVAIFGGIAMFGIVGVFVGPVFAATLIALLQIWPTVGKRFGLTFDPPMQVVIEKRKSDLS
jgi:predicted PurR-regulated permease PerM